MTAPHLLTVDDETLVEIDPAAGGRLARLVVAGLDLLVPAEPGRGPDSGDPFGWGCFPMVPFAGRLRHGRFTFGGREVQLPANFGRHAIHGYGATAAWTVLGPGQLTLELPPPWPLGGRATQRISLGADRLELELAVHAGPAGPMPAQVGWHPWFRRHLARGGPAEVAFEAAAQYRRDTGAIPTGELIAPTSGPWDDCFTRLGAPPSLHWPGALRVTVEHDCDHLVIFDALDHAICVEPQSGPPDGFNLAAVVVEPGRPLVAHCTIRWS